LGGTAFQITFRLCCISVNTPDAVMTHYSTNYAPKVSQFDVNFAISVGVEYKFKKKR